MCSPARSVALVDSFPGFAVSFAVEESVAGDARFHVLIEGKVGSNRAHGTQHRGFCFSDIVLGAAAQEGDPRSTRCRVAQERVVAEPGVFFAFSEKAKTKEEK